ncbi:MAG: alpha-L-fucosidase [Kiritimatiellaeota bacterium]|nr:alpha-L-fucosidase [Kiritimatiellota bacterium]
MAEPATERTEALARYEGMRYGMFIHFTMNTFLDGAFCATVNGPLPGPERYAPEGLDVDQWLDVAKRAGMRYAVLTAKHYVGFALWDSDCSDYDVASSGCTTDVVAEFVKACRRHGLAPGLYYALGVDTAHRRDRGMTDAEWYGHVHRQMGELLTGYGPISVFWFDGLGPVGPGRLQEAYDVVKAHQPDCLVVVNHGHGSNGSRLRYWPTDVIAGERTLPPPQGHNPRLEHDGTTYYLPMETCDTSAQGTFSKGWFPEPGEQMKEVQRELLPLYRKATERGANLLLNVAVDRRGQIPAATAERLLELAEAIEKSKT